jgi:hypothetical protein
MQNMELVVVFLLIKKDLKIFMLVNSSSLEKEAKMTRTKTRKIIRQFSKSLMVLANILKRWMIG